VALQRNVAQKRAAGASGFFTQPLFDLRDVDRCAALLDDTTTFWGLSPVVSDRSQRYWQQVNRVQFPSEFVPTLHWNQRFALRFLSEIADRGGNAYLMPIKVDIERYLAPLEARFA
jgi:methylenetetrahydrofolate reductase (NADPH)